MIFLRFGLSSLRKQGMQPGGLMILISVLGVSYSSHCVEFNLGLFVRQSKLALSLSAEVLAT